MLVTFHSYGFSSSVHKGERVTSSNLSLLSRSLPFFCLIVLTIYSGVVGAVGEDHPMIAVSGCYIQMYPSVIFLDSEYPQNF